MILKWCNEMSKTDYIQERYIKDVLNEEELNENEFYAEQYADDLSMQHNDSEQEQPKDVVILAVKTAQRIKPFIIDVEDLNYKLQRLKQLKEAIRDNELPIVTETTDCLLRIVDNEIENTKSDIQLKGYEIKQICEVV